MYVVLHCELKKNFCKKIFFIEIWYIYFSPISVSSVPSHSDDDMWVEISLPTAFLYHGMWQLEIS